MAEEIIEPVTPIVPVEPTTEPVVVTPPVEPKGDKMFTQDDVNKMISDRLKRADTKAESKVYEEYGFGSKDEFTGFIENTKNIAETLKQEKQDAKEKKVATIFEVAGITEEANKKKLLSLAKFEEGNELEQLNKAIGTYGSLLKPSNIGADTSNKPNTDTESDFLKEYNKRRKK